MSLCVPLYSDEGKELMEYFDNNIPLVLFVIKHADTVEDLHKIIADIKNGDETLIRLFEEDNKKAYERFINKSFQDKVNEVHEDHEKHKVPLEKTLTSEERKAVAFSIINYILAKQGKKVYDLMGGNLELDYSLISSYLEEQLKDAVDNEDINKYREVHSFLQPHNVEFTEKVVKETIAEMFAYEEAEEDQMAKILGNSVKDKAEIDPKKNIRGVIKLWLSLIPERTGKSLLYGAFNTHVPLDKSNRFLEETLSDLSVEDDGDIFDVMLEKLYELKTLFPEVQDIIDALEDSNTPEKFKTEFVKSFNRAFTTYTSVFTQEKKTKEGGYTFTSYKPMKFRHNLGRQQTEALGSFVIAALNKLLRIARAKAYKAKKFNPLNKTVNPKKASIELFESFLQDLRKNKEELERMIRTKDTDLLRPYLESGKIKEWKDWEPVFYEQLFKLFELAHFPINKEMLRQTIEVIKTRDRIGTGTQNYYKDDFHNIRESLKLIKDLNVFLLKKYEELYNSSLDTTFSGDKIIKQLNQDFTFFKYDPNFKRHLDFFLIYAKLNSTTFENSITSFDNKNFYPYNSKDTLDIIIERMKAGHLEDWEKEVFDNLSVLIAEKESLLGIRDEQKAIPSKELTFIDELILKLGIMDKYDLSSSPFPYLTLADKSKVFALGTGMDDSLQYTLHRILAEETRRVARAYRNVFGIDGEKKLDESELIEGWHYKLDANGNKIFRDSEGFPVGDAFTKTLFADLFRDERYVHMDGEKGLPKLVDDYVSGDIDLTSFRDKVDNLKVLTPYLDVIRQSLIDDLIEQGVLKKKEDSNGEVTYDMDSKVADIINKLISRYGNYAPESKLKSIGNKEENLEGLLFVLEMMTGAHLIQAYAFHGGLAPWKTIENFLKRVPAISGAGDYVRIHKSKWGNVRAKFKVAIMSNKFGKSKITNKKIKNHLLETLSEEEVDEILSFFNEVNRADAAGVITPRRFKEIIIGIYGWNEELETAYQNALKGTATGKELKLLLSHAPLQSLKGVHFELINKNGEIIPIYLKYSSFPLFPQLVSGKGKRYLKLMEKSGVDELITKDGSKGISPELNKFEDPGELLSNGETLSSFELKNRFWKLQQENPYHAEDKASIGVQLKRNLIANLEHPVKTQSGEELSPSEYRNELAELETELSDRNSELSGQEMGMEKSKTTGATTIREETFFERMKNLFSSPTDSGLIKKFFENKQILDGFGSLSRQVEYKLFSIFRKAAVRFKERGNALIQVSPEFFEEVDKTYADLTKEEQDQILWLKDKEELEPPQIIEEDEGNKKVTYGQVLIPFHVVESLPEYKKYKAKGKKALVKYIKETLDQDTLKLIGYRIPNQKLSFNQPLEIAGILPRSMGNTIVAYSEIAVQTGSDYDIDKMFIYMPYVKFNRKTGKLERVKYLNDLNSNVEERYELMKKEWKLSDVFARKIIEIENSDEEILNLKRAIAKEIIGLGITEQDVAMLLEDLKDETHRLFSEETTSMNQLKAFIDDNLYGFLGLDTYSKLTDLYNRLSFELSSRTRKRAEEITLNQLIQDDIFPSLEVFETLPLVKQNTKEAISNRKFELYEGLLTTPAYYSQLISSVDTEFLKQNAKILYESFGEQPIISFSPLRQIKTHIEFMNSKAGVGITANAQAIAIYQQYYGAVINGAYGELYTDEYTLEKDENGNFEKKYYRRILKTEVISAFMNAFVDAAKDNYIGKARITTDVLSTVFEMVFRGISTADILLLFRNDKLAEYIRAKQDFKNVSTSLSFGKAEQIEKEVEKSLTEEDRKKLQELQEDNRDFRDILYDDTISETIKNYITISVYDEYSEYSRNMRALRSMGRLDVEAAGKNVSELLYKLFIWSRNNVELIQHKLNALPQLKAYFNNSVGNIITLLQGQKFLLSSAGFSFLDSMQTYLGTVHKEEVLRLIDNEVLTAFAQTQLKRHLGWDPKEIENLLVGDYSVTERILKYMEKHEFNPAVPGMLLFNNIVFSTGGDNFALRRIPRMKRVNRTDTQVEDIRHDWYLLYLTDRQLAVDLAVVALTTYGIGGSKNNLATYIPKYVYDNLGLTGENYREFLKEIQTGDFNEALALQIIRQLSRKREVVPYLGSRSLVSLKSDGKETGYVAISTSDAAIKRSMIHAKKFSTPPRFIQSNKSVIEDSIDNTTLFELVGAIYERGSHEDEHYDKVYIYKAIPKLGRTNKYGTLVFREYDLLTDDLKSISFVNELNLPNVDEKEIIAKAAAIGLNEHTKKNKRFFRKHTPLHLDFLMNIRGLLDNGYSTLIPAELDTVNMGHIPAPSERDDFIDRETSSAPTVVPDTSIEDNITNSGDSFIEIPADSIPELDEDNTSSMLSDDGFPSISELEGDRFTNPFDIPESSLSSGDKFVSSQDTDSNDIIDNEDDISDRFDDDDDLFLNDEDGNNC